MNKTTRILLPTVGALLVATGVLASDTTRMVKAQPVTQVVVAESVTADTAVAGGVFAPGTKDTDQEISRAPLIVFAFFADGAQLDDDRRAQIDSFRRDLQLLRRNLTEPDLVERGRKEMIIDACIRMLEQGLRDGRVDASALDDWRREVHPLATAEKQGVHTQQFRRTVASSEIARIS